MSVIQQSVSSSSGADCGTGRTSDDTCSINCINGGDLRSAPIDCGDAGHCIIDCDRKRCLRESVINATLAHTLEITATAQECLRQSDIYFPVNGNVSIIVDPQGADGADSIAKAANLYSQASDHIDIKCRDPLSDETSKQECNTMNIYAQDAQFLSVTVNGAEFYTSNEIHCPLHSIRAPSCVVNATNAHLMTESVSIYIGNGSIPSDLLWYGGSNSDYGADDKRVKVICSQGISVLNEVTNSFENVAPCWKPPTFAPTTAAPTNVPTASPITASPSSVSPTKGPTAAPVTSPPTTTDPTSSPITTKAPTIAPTSGPPTSGPTVSPVTSSPTTSSPTTAAPSSSPFAVHTTSDIWITATELREHQFTSSVFSVSNEFGPQQALSFLGLSPMYVIIGGGILLVLVMLCIACCCYLLCRHHSRLKDAKSVELEEYMSNNKMAGFGENKLYQPKKTNDTVATKEIHGEHCTPYTPPLKEQAAAPANANAPPLAPQHHHTQVPHGAASLPANARVFNVHLPHPYAVAASYPNNRYNPNILQVQTADNMASYDGDGDGDDNATVIVNDTPVTELDDDNVTVIVNATPATEYCDDNATVLVHETPDREDSYDMETPAEPHTVLNIETPLTVNAFTPSIADTVATDHEGVVQGNMIPAMYIGMDSDKMPVVDTLTSIIEKHKKQNEYEDDDDEQDSDY